MIKWYIKWGINMYVCWVGLVLYEGVMGYIRRCKYICVKCNVLYLLCYVKGICELRWGYLG